MAAVERDLRGPAQPHAPVPRQGRRRARPRVRGPAVLPGPDGRRRARLPRPRGAGGGGPARAHRADARRRDQLQQALRRDARRPRGQHPDGRRPRARPQGARQEDVDHRRHARGHGLRRRGAREHHQEVQARGDRLGARDRARRRQAGHLEPDRDPRRSCAARRPSRSRPTSRARATATSRPPSAPRSPSGWRPTRARYLELREDTAAIEAIFETGAEKAHAIASGVVADVRERMGVGPVRTHA